LLVFIEDEVFFDFFDEDFFEGGVGNGILGVGFLLPVFIRS